MKKIGFILLLCLLGGNLFAASLKVSPAGFIIDNVTPGKTYNLYEATKVKISVYNDDVSSHTYRLSVHKPSETGRWEKGYLEIPDPGWCWFENKEVTVAPHKVGYGNLFVKIPEEERYYNQHWIATLGIMGKPEGGIGVGLGVYVRVQIETGSRADAKGTPDGIIGFKPSTVRFKNIAPGVSHQAKVEMYNNDIQSHTYSIESLFQNEEIKKKTYLTRSFKTVPDPGWISPDTDTLTIKPNSKSVISLKLHIPDTPDYYGRKWEEILLVQSDNRLSGFIRIQIETRKQR